MSSSEPRVRLEQEGPVAQIIIDSPSNRNALGASVLAALLSNLNEAIASATIRVIVLSATGSVFSSGADLSQALHPEAIARAYRDLFEGISEAPKPIVARVNGHCFGAAIGLATVCDLSVTVDDALWGFTEVRLGQIATLASVVSLPRLRSSDAADLLLRGNRINGVRAAQIGLVNKAVPREYLDAEIQQIVTDLLAGGPEALAGTKRLIREIPVLGVNDTWDLAFQIAKESADSPESIEGARAFREKREPEWPT